MAKWNRENNRILYNGDANFLFSSDIYNPNAETYSAEFIHAWIELIADSGVDTYVCNVNAQLPWYPSRAVPNILTGYERGDSEFVRGHFPPTNDTDFTLEMLNDRCKNLARLLDRYLDLQDVGVDWIAEIAAACKRRGVSPWVSIRMNDMHGSNSWKNSFMNCPPQRDPALRLSGHSINPKEPASSKLQAVDYSHPEARNFMLTMIREVIVDYDFEGIQLDWLRCPFCCEAPASDVTIRTMMEFLAAIREIAHEKSRITGKPYPVGLRTPRRLDLLRNIGLDVKAYSRLGLIDFLSVSNFLQSTWDVDYVKLRQDLGADVTLYGAIEGAANWLEVFSPAMQKRMYRLNPASPALLRGNAAGKLASGADGIELYNFFIADEPRRHSHSSWSQRGADYSSIEGLQDMESLHGKPKHYLLASMNGPYMFPLWESAEQSPVTIFPGDRQVFRFAMCAEPSDSQLTLSVQLVVERASTTDHFADLGVSFNGSWPQFDGSKTDELLIPCGDFTEHVSEHTAYNFDLPIDSIQEGFNELLVFYGTKPRPDQAEQKLSVIRIVSVELAVR